MAKKEKFLQKRIIAGEFKNKPIKLPSLSTTRSSKGIVLESFFNTVQFEIIDSIFVEVFSGSGSVGLEALSRGAQKIYFMEKDRNALKILQENINSLDPSRCEVYGGDSFINIKTIVNMLQKRNQEAYFYIDPPFSFREGFEDIYEQTMQLIASLPTEVVKLIAVEHMTGLELPQSLGKFEKTKSKKFGKTSLTYYLA